MAHTDPSRMCHMPQQNITRRHPEAQPKLSTLCATESYSANASVATLHNQSIPEHNTHGESPQTIPTDTENLVHKNLHDFCDTKTQTIRSGTERTPRPDKALA